MSTDRSRLVSSIRRIVLTDPDLSSALDAWQNRGDQASSTGTGTSDAERDRLCCDGSTSENPNPGADTRDTSEGGQDGLNEDDPALLDSGPGSLTGVTDCATGQPICFDGGGFVPPDGWDEPNEPPLDFGYIEGYYWGRSNNDEDYRGASPSIVADLHSAAAPSRDYYVGELIASDETGPAQMWIGFTTEETDNPEAHQVYRYDCSGGFGDDAYCNPDISDVSADTWPSDGCTNLAIKNGTIVGSKYDPENDGTYSKPMSEIELCDGSGNSFFLSPASDGGWKTIDATKTDGYLYDSQGNKIAHIDGNEYADPDV